MSNEYNFGISRERPSRAEAKRMEGIARKHGAWLVEMSSPSTNGYQRWFACVNRGEPFNSSTARTVLDEIDPPIGPCDHPPHRRGTRGGLRSWEVCLQCGDVVRRSRK